MREEWSKERREGWLRGGRREKENREEGREDEEGG